MSVVHMFSPLPMPGTFHLVTQHAPCFPSFDVQPLHGHLLGSTGFVDGARVSDDGTGVGGMLVAGHQCSLRPESTPVPESGSPLHVVESKPVMHCVTVRLYTALDCTPQPPIMSKPSEKIAVEAKTTLKYLYIFQHQRAQHKTFEPLAP